jgi:hypothetical protein
MSSYLSKKLFLLGVVIGFPSVLSSPCAEIATKFGTWKSEGGKESSKFQQNLNLINCR